MLVKFTNTVSKSFQVHPSFLVHLSNIKKYGEYVFLTSLASYRNEFEFLWQRYTPTINFLR